MKDLKAELQARKDARLYRQRSIYEAAGPGRVRDSQGRVLLNFSSNDYLGLAQDERLARVIANSSARMGVGSGAAHLITGHHRTHHQLEEELADFTGRERALLFSTGYMANLGVISALVGSGDTVFEDRLNHASLLDGGLLSRARVSRYEHLNVSALEKKLQTSKAQEKLIVTDGVFSMDGDVAPLDELARVAAEQDAWLMVDDAHGLGVLGEQGRGSVHKYQLNQQQVPILMGTLGKAIGVSGAFVAGSEDLIEYLIQKARPYIYTTAMPAVLAEAARCSLRIIREDSWRHDHLFGLIRRLRWGTEMLGLPLMVSDTPIQPLLTHSAEQALAWSEALRERGFLISAIRPPTVPEGSARLRITLSAAHSDEDVDELIQALGECRQVCAA